VAGKYQAFPHDLSSWSNGKGKPVLHPIYIDVPITGKRKARKKTTKA
jgi:hypothetical protein